MKKKRLKIILISIMMILIFSISIFADNVVVNPNLHQMYYFRSYNDNSYYYWSIYTRDNIKDVDYEFYDPDYVQDLSSYYAVPTYELLKKYEYFSIGYKVTNYVFPFDNQYQINFLDDLLYNFTGGQYYSSSFSTKLNSTISTQINKNINIAQYFFGGWYAYQSSAISPTYHDFDDVMTGLQNGNLSYNYTAIDNIKWYMFIDSLQQAFAYNQLTREKDNDSCVMFNCSQQLYNDFCYSLYNILYYEYNLTDITYSLITSFVGSYITTYPDTMNFNSFWELSYYMNKDSKDIFADKRWKSYISNVYSSSDVDEATSFYNELTYAQNYLNQTGWYYWLPHNVGDLILKGVLAICGVSVLVVVKKFVFV